MRSKVHTLVRQFKQLRVMFQRKKKLWLIWFFCCEIVYQELRHLNGCVVGAKKLASRIAIYMTSQVGLIYDVRARYDRICLAFPFFESLLNLAG